MDPQPLFAPDLGPSLDEWAAGLVGHGGHAHPGLRRAGAAAGLLSGAALVATAGRGPARAGIERVGRRGHGHGRQLSRAGRRLAHDGAERLTRAHERVGHLHVHLPPLPVGRS